MNPHGFDYRWAFATGWREAVLGVAPETAREVAGRYPDLSVVEIDVYLNGVEDGKVGDRFRLDHA